MGERSAVDTWLALEADDRIAAIAEDPSLCDFIAGDIESHRDLADELGREILALRADAITVRLAALRQANQAGAEAMRERAAAHCHREAAAIEEESVLAAHVLRAAGRAIAKMGAREDGGSDGE